MDDKKDIELWLPTYCGPTYRRSRADFPFTDRNDPNLVALSKQCRPPTALLIF
jgi:hypothetical protein